MHCQYDCSYFFVTFSFLSWSLFPPGFIFLFFPIVSFFVLGASSNISWSLVMLLFKRKALKGLRAWGAVGQKERMWQVEQLLHFLEDDQWSGLNSASRWSSSISIHGICLWSSSDFSEWNTLVFYLGGMYLSTQILEAQARIELRVP